MNIMELNAQVAREIFKWSNIVQDGNMWVGRTAENAGPYPIFNYAIELNVIKGHILSKYGSYNINVKKNLYEVTINNKHTAIADFEGIALCMAALAAERGVTSIEDNIEIEVGGCCGQ